MKEQTKAMKQIKTLKLIKDLIETLEEKNVSYCHWKSNAAFVETLTGINDFDVLVALKDKDAFLDVLDSFGFFRGISANEKWVESIHHYYGYDQTSGTIVHFHVHYKLILGFDLIKNYHVTVESAFLDSPINLMGLQVPRFEVELVMFVIRMVLKRRLIALIFGHPKRWVKTIFGTGRDALSKNQRAELDFLKGKADANKLNEYLRQYFPFLKIDLFNYCLSSLDNKPHKFAWFVAGWRLTRALRCFRRHGSLSTVFLVATRILKIRFTAVLRHLGCQIPSRKRLEFGGRIIAFAGGDGAGKTTNIQEVKAWLGKYMNVEVIHVGKPPKSIFRLLGLGLTKVGDFIVGKNRSTFAKAFNYWALGRDRYYAFQRAKNLRAQGSIVILDRVPLPGIKMMDIPRIRTTTSGRGIYAWLSKLEEEYHSKIVGVDDLIILKLDPKIAQIRRAAEQDQDFLVKRSTEIWEHKWKADYAYVVDAGKPLADVKEDIRKRVWNTVSRQAKIIEILGPAGSGKSTVARELVPKISNLYTRFPFRDYKGAYFKNMLKNLPMLVYLKCKKVPLRFLRTVVNIQTTLDVLQHQDYAHRPIFTAMAFDQGPLYQLSSLRFLQQSLPDCPRMDGWLSALEEKAVELYDMVFWLDAPDEVLFERVNSREQQHRIKGNGRKEAYNFFKNYRSLFNKIVNSKPQNQLSVKRIDTTSQSVEVIVGEIANYLGVRGLHG